MMIVSELTCNLSKPNMPARAVAGAYKAPVLFWATTLHARLPKAARRAFEQPYARSFSGGLVVYRLAYVLGLVGTSHRRYTQYDSDVFSRLPDLYSPGLFVL